MEPRLDRPGSVWSGDAGPRGSPRACASDRPRKKAPGSATEDGGMEDGGMEDRGMEDGGKEDRRMEEEREKQEGWQRRTATQREGWKEGL